MKLHAALCFALLLASCGSNQDDGGPVRGFGTQAERDTMLKQIAEFTTLLHDMEDSLSTVAEDVVYIAEESGERRNYSRQMRDKLGQVMARLDAYRMEIEEAKRENEILMNRNAVLQNSNESTIIANLQGMLAKRDSQIVDLQTQLANAQIKLEDAVAARVAAEEAWHAERSGRIQAEQDKALEEAARRRVQDSLRRERVRWYIADTEDGLKRKGFEWKGEATFLKFGGHLAPGPNTDIEAVFTKIEDVSTMSEYATKGNIVRIHSAHGEREEYYTLRDKSLLIENWRAFWAAGQYLVIEVEND